MNKRRFLAAGSLALLLPPQLNPAFAGGPTFQVDALVLLDAYRTLVEEHLAGILTTLKVVARSPEARSGKWEEVKPLVEEMGKDIPSQAAVWYALPDGSYDTAADGHTDQNLSDRAYFPALMSGQDVIGALVVSKSTGHRSVIVAAPVVVDGKTVAALGVSVRARLLSDIVTKRTNMPPSVVLYALDATGKTALHRDPEQMFHYPSDMGDASLNHAVAEIMAGTTGTLTYSSHGKEHPVAYAASRLTGWKFVLVGEPG